MKIITSMNFKGGSGKTTTTFHLAAGLANRGLKTLLIDADAQAHSTYLCGAAEEPAFHDLIVRRAPFSNVIRPVAREHYALGENAAPLFLVPSDMETRVVPMQTSDPFIAHRRFHELKDFVDVIVVDTSPEASSLQTMLFVATDAIIYPTKLEALSINGLGKSLEHRQQAQPMRLENKMGEVEIAGILPTMYRSSTLEHGDYLNALTDQFGDVVLPAISDRIVWAEASRAQKPVFCYEPDGKAAQETWRLVDLIKAQL